jgi:hypothetical protein
MRSPNLSLRSAGSFSLLCVSLAVVGCGGEAPTPGIWQYDELATASNTCNYEGVESNGNGGFRLVDEGDGAYRVDPADGSDPFECTLDGDELSCPKRAAQTLSIAGVDATLSIKVTATATVEAADAMSGTQNGTVTCSGSDCDAAAASVGASFPCTFELDFVATLEQAE